MLAKAKRISISPAMKSIKAMPIFRLFLLNM
jgi:hypothetical protein